MCCYTDVLSHSYVVQLCCTGVLLYRCVVQIFCCTLVLYRCVVVQVCCLSSTVLRQQTIGNYSVNNPSVLTNSRTHPPASTHSIVCSPHTETPTPLTWNPSMGIWMSDKVFYCSLVFHQPFPSDQSQVRELPAGTLLVKSWPFSIISSPPPPLLARTSSPGFITRRPPLIGGPEEEPKQLSLTRRRADNGAVLPTSSPHNLSHPECEAMEKYIIDSSAEAPAICYISERERNGKQHFLLVHFEYLVMPLGSTKTLVNDGLRDLVPCTLIKCSSF